MQKSFRYSDRRGLPGGPNEESSFGEGFVVSERGQWDYPGMNTLVPTDGNITMQGVPYPVMAQPLYPDWAQPAVGPATMMYPDQDYYFPGAVAVAETPMARYGGGLKKYQTGKEVNNNAVVSYGDLPYDPNVQDIKTLDEISISPYTRMRSQLDTPQARDQWIDQNLPKFSRSMGINRDNWNPDEWEKYQKSINTKLAEDIFKRKPFTAGDGNRVENLKQYTPEELDIIKGSSYADKISPTVWDKFKQGVYSLIPYDYSLMAQGYTPMSPVKASGLTNEEAVRENTPLNLLQPLSIPQKMVQAGLEKIRPTVTGGYTMSEALSGVENDAPMTDKFYTDPLNLVGVGLFKGLGAGSTIGRNIGRFGEAVNYVPEDIASFANIGSDAAATASKINPKSAQLTFDFGLPKAPVNTDPFGVYTSAEKLIDDLQKLKETQKYEKNISNYENTIQEVFGGHEGYKKAKNLYKGDNSEYLTFDQLVEKIKGKASENIKQSSLNLQKPITSEKITYQQPLSTDQDYIDWARKIHPDLARIATPEELRQAHIEALDYFGKSPVGLEGKEYGMYMRNKFADRIPSYTYPTSYDFEGNILHFPPDHPHTSFMPWGTAETASLKHGNRYTTLLDDILRNQGYSTQFLTPQEVNAIYGYAKGYDAPINGVLRAQSAQYNPSLLNSLNLSLKTKPGSKTAEFYGDIAEMLNQGIQRNKLKNPISVKRGIGSDYNVELLHPTTFEPTGQVVKRSELNLGDVFKDASFISSSHQGPLYEWGTPGLSEYIDLPGGGIQSYAYPNALSWSPFLNEFEFILPKNLVRRVESITDNPMSAGYKYRTSILNPHQMGGAEDESDEQFPMGTMNVNIQDIPDDVLAIMIANNR